jgi:hypothetical protein
MSVTNYLEQATALRREARRAWFLASGPTALHAQLIAAATALERAAGMQASAENNLTYKRGA